MQHLGCLADPLFVPYFNDRGVATASYPALPRLTFGLDASRSYQPQDVIPKRGGSNQRPNRAAQRPKAQENAAKRQKTGKAGRSYSPEDRLDFEAKFKAEKKAAKEQGLRVSGREFARKNGLSEMTLNHWVKSRKYGGLVSSNFKSDLEKIRLVNKFYARRQEAKNKGETLSAEEFSKRKGLGTRAIGTWEKLITAGIITNPELLSRERFEKSVELFERDNMGLSRRLFAEVCSVAITPFQVAIREKTGVEKKKLERMDEEKREQLVEFIKFNFDISDEQIGKKFNISGSTVAYHRAKLYSRS